MINIAEELKKILAAADAEIQKVIQPAVQSGSDKLVELGNQAIRTIQTPIKNLIIRIDQNWSQEDKKQMVEDYMSGKRDALSGRPTVEEAESHLTEEAPPTEEE